MSEYCSPAFLEVRGFEMFSGEQTMVIAKTGCIPKAGSVHTVRLPFALRGHKSGHNPDTK